MSDSDRPIDAGQVFGGRWRIERARESGVFGRLFDATYTRQLWRVSLWVPLELGDERSEFWERVKSLKNVDVLRVQRVLDADESDESQPSFVVTELVRGESLARVMRTDVPLAAEFAIGIALQLCQAASALARHGLSLAGLDLHEIYFERETGDVSLLPFSLIRQRARARGRSASLTGRVGQPGYVDALAPEDVAGKGRDARSDVYAVGALLFELVTGGPLFSGVSQFGRLSKKLTERAPELRRPDGGPLSAELKQAVARALERDPAERPQTADVLWELLVDAPESIALRRLRKRSREPDEVLVRGTIARSGALPSPAPAAAAARAPAPAPSAPVLAAPPAPAAPAPAAPAPAPDAVGPQPLTATQAPPRIDEDVQFTLYRPETVAPHRWEILLLFTHKAKADPETPAVNPLTEVERRAEQLLGSRLNDYAMARMDAKAGLPRESEITIVPRADHVRFNPPSARFIWLEPVHTSEFRFSVDASEDGKVVRGALAVYLGPLLIAEVPFVVSVATGAVSAKPERAAAARIFRRIFPSYAHADAPIVELCGRVIQALGVEYLRDIWTLRSGDRWHERLAELIDQADVFQLFWSTNAMKSEYVRAEWEYALAHRGAQCIRPVYWETPFPRDDGAGLPPPALSSLHFAHLALGAGKEFEVRHIPDLSKSGRSNHIVGRDQDAVTTKPYGLPVPRDEIYSAPSISAPPHKVPPGRRSRLPLLVAVLLFALATLTAWWHFR